MGILGTRTKLSLIICSILIACSLTICIHTSNAATRKVKASQLKKSSIKYRSKVVKFSCLGRTPGTTKTTSSFILFTPYSDQIRKLTARKYKAKRATLSAIAKLAAASCKILSIPTPTPTPTPTNTPEPTFSPGNFDSNGNVTDAGKTLFEIPSHLSGNISLGRDIFDSYCTGCHIERVNRTFPDIRTNIANPPMNYDDNDLPDADLANLIAYLNRFRF